MAEEALRQSAAQFETLLNEAPFGVYVVDADFRIWQVNRTARRVFGDIPNLIGRDCDEVIHILWPQEYADEIVRLFRHTLETGKSYTSAEQMEERLDRGMMEYYEWQVSRVPLPEGRYGLVCYFRDISAQALAQQALAESAEQRRRTAEGLRAIAARAHCLLWYADVEDRGDPFLYWTQQVADEEAARRFLPLVMPLGHTYARALSAARLPEDKARMAWGDEQVRAGKSYQQEFRVRDANGNIRWLAEDVQVEVIGPNRWYAVGVCVDITERKQIEEALRQSEQRINRDLEAMTLLHQVGTRCAREGSGLTECLELILEAAISITGADKGNIQLHDAETGGLVIAAHRRLAQPFLEFFACVNGCESACGVSLQAATRVIVEDVTNSDIFAGQPSLDVLLTEGIRAVQSTPLVSNSGRVLGMVSTHFCDAPLPGERELRLMDLLALQAGDFLQRVRQEELLKAHLMEIEDLNARLKRAMAETHHRVKNNLQVISALVDIETMIYEGNVPVDELIRIGQHVRSLAAIHDLLTQNAKSTELTESIGTAEIMGMLAPLLRSTIGARELRLEVEDIKLPMRQGTSLAVLVNELVSNAIKHGAGEIVISLAANGNRARLIVSDQGPGFSEDFNTQSSRHTGMELIESMGRHDLRGTVTYENKPEGGARVVVDFPTGPAPNGEWNLK